METEPEFNDWRENNTNIAWGNNWQTQLHSLRGQNKWSEGIDNNTDEFDGFDQDFSTDDFDEYYGQNSLKIGDKVRSPAFGDGKVRDIDGSAIEIEFENGKIRKLNAEYARLERI